MAASTLPFHLCLVAQCSEKGVPGSPLVLFAFPPPCEARSKLQLLFLVGLPKCDGGGCCQCSQEMVLRVDLHRCQAMAVSHTWGTVNKLPAVFRLIQQQWEAGDCGSACGYWAAALGLQFAASACRSLHQKLTLNIPWRPKWQVQFHRQQRGFASFLPPLLWSLTYILPGTWVSVPILNCQNGSCCLCF